MQLHQEILDDKRLEVWRQLPSFKKIGYLAGGTALALQLGHRVSYDFDIFCPKPISAGFISRVNKNFSVKNVFVNNADEFSFITAAGIKISFIYYPFDLKDYVKINRASLPLLSVAGIALTKAYALNRRQAWRDYVDLYFIMHGGHASLKRIISLAPKVYGELFSEKLFLAQLLYTEDIEPNEIKNTIILRDRSKINLKQVKDFFRRQINKYMKEKK
ncbi:hypothetical protein COU01_00685 [Candidatus Falkowbacteria bacterium CG10_big_fil_rev_8_21_14_0_10_44_15]|uniref:Nucleotidyl transferase AbiEii/AbiGii toxin family protein n=1 Tax=Candidatus Falkowbacteria bacterium CG10_big_fil_rev_8_21_14_0_10_44_15 TaxID=1974569 RepID=A0A2H0V0L2_9BACT|nr:MAG: hypothetical protein COU01_00685 [Candidatus Falkowbacteria bacterium CG10_big_fil_rev_8_21_14_0_10_44_15]